jgi:hypothetical protein
LTELNKETAPKETRKTDDTDFAFDEAVKAGGIPCEYHLKNLTEIVKGYLDEEHVYTMYCGRDDTE